MLTKRVLSRGLASRFPCIRAGLTLGGLLSRPARCRPHIAGDTPETVRHLIGAPYHIRRRAGRPSERPRQQAVARAAVAGPTATLLDPSPPTENWRSPWCWWYEGSIRERRRRFLPSPEGRGLRAVKNR